VRGAVAVLGAITASLVACGDDSGGRRDGDSPGTAGQSDRRGGTLGGSATTRALARTRLAERPPGELAWVAHERRLAPGETIAHRHEFAFVYARRGPHSLHSAGRAASLRAGTGAAVEAKVRHRHEARGGRSTFWDIRLAPAGSPAPPGLGTARRVFQSEPLEGIPEPADAAFIEVAVPPRGGRTTVHTHPGPEFIYQLSGRIDYQNAIIGTRRLGPGGAEGIPPATAVQKRNPFERPATFLSFFLVDPDRPFAPKARF
jgi:quercetin dioxygenase-like cupin family protein